MSLPSPRRFTACLFALCVLASLVAGVPAASAQSDTTATASDWLLLPFAGFSPETQLEVGIVGGLYGAARPGERPSSVDGVVSVTTERQLIVQVQPEVYLGGQRWRVVGEALWSRFPDKFYGIGGDTPDRFEEAFTSQYGVLDFAFQRRVTPAVRVGPSLYVRNETAADTDEGCPAVDPLPGSAFRPPALACDLVPGHDGGWTNGLGVSAIVDTRDDLFFPTGGAFVTADATWHSAVLGSATTFGRMTLDASAYRSLGTLPGWFFGDGPLVVAGNAYAASIVGDATFQRLAQLGGPARMRGYRQGRYRDDVYWTVQTEVRVPFFWRFRGVAFASAGEVASRVGDDLFSGVEVAAGLGGRLRVTDNGVYGRLDLALGPDGPQIYISLGEAF